MQKLRVDNQNKTSFRQAHKKDRSLGAIKGRGLLTDRFYLEDGE
jgi:hypothetical protein